MGWGPCPKAETVQLPAPPCPWVSDRVSAPGSCFLHQSYSARKLALLDIHSPASSNISHSHEDQLEYENMPYLFFLQLKTALASKAEKLFFTADRYVTQKKGKEMILRESYTSISKYQSSNISSTHLWLEYKAGLTFKMSECHMHCFPRWWLLSSRF